MKDFVSRMITEHANLATKIGGLEKFIYDNDGLNVLTDVANNATQEDVFRNMTEYANACMQLTAMKAYIKALECRLNNQGVYFENGAYLEKVASLE